MLYAWGLAKDNQILESSTQMVTALGINKFM